MRKLQATIEEIQSPPKANQKHVPSNYNTSQPHKKEEVKLVSYAQRRTQYKKNVENTLNSSIDQLFSSTKLLDNRSTIDFKSDLIKLQEGERADTMPDDK